MGQNMNEFSTFKLLKHGDQILKTPKRCFLERKPKDPLRTTKYLHNPNIYQKHSFLLEVKIFNN